MPYLVKKLPGASGPYFFKHEGERVHPTAEGVILDSRPNEIFFTDPWLKIDELSAGQAKVVRAELAKAKADAEKVAKDAAKKTEQENSASLKAKADADAAKEIRSECEALLVGLEKLHGAPSAETRAKLLEKLIADEKFRAEIAAEITPPRDAEGLRLDGPTLEEFTKAGYPAEKYPPQGYAKKA